MLEPNAWDAQAPPPLPSGPATPPLPPYLPVGATPLPAPGQAHPSSLDYELAPFPRAAGRWSVAETAAHNCVSSTRAAAEPGGPVALAAAHATSTHAASEARASGHGASSQLGREGQDKDRHTHKRLSNDDWVDHLTSISKKGKHHVMPGATRPRLGCCY